MSELGCSEEGIVQKKLTQCVDKMGEEEAETTLDQWVECSIEIVDVIANHFSE